jgi:hypothetical protein
MLAPEFTIPGHISYSRDAWAKNIFFSYFFLCGTACRSLLGHLLWRNDQATHLFNIRGKSLKTKLEK